MIRQSDIMCRVAGMLSAAFGVAVYSTTQEIGYPCFLLAMTRAVTPDGPTRVKCDCSLSIGYFTDKQLAPDLKDADRFAMYDLMDAAADLCAAGVADVCGRFLHIDKASSELIGDERDIAAVDLAFTYYDAPDEDAPAVPMRALHLLTNHKED